MERFTNDRVAVSPSPTANASPQQPTQVQPKQPRRGTTVNIELNINLKVINHANSVYDCDARLVAAMVFFKLYFVNFDITRDEDILIARVETGHDTIDTILRKIAALSAHLEQDCIALRWPHHYEGVLVGPKATTWGAWDEAKFKRFGAEAN
jgi:hypothetical protein